MSYQYYAYIPIEQEIENKACLLRYKDGEFEVYKKNEWVKSPEFFSIFVREYSDFEKITQDNLEDAMRVYSS